jgi:hypothetical protein
MNIREIASADAITGMFLNKVLAQSVILDKFAEFFTGAGNSTVYRVEQDSVGAATRVLEEEYDKQTLRPEYHTSARKIFGGSVKIDVAYERMGYDIPSEFNAQLSRMAPGVVDKFHQMLINGDADTDAEQFNGLKKLVLPAQTILADTNGLTVKLGNGNAEKTSQQKFLEKLDEVIQTARGSRKIIICNGKMLARLNTIAREYIQWTETTFGNKIASYNGYPLINIEANTMGSVLPFTEECGTANDTASLYVVSFEEQAGMSFFTTREGFMVYPMQNVDNWYSSRVDFIVDSALFRPKAIARLQGIKFD